MKTKPDSIPQIHMLEASAGSGKTFALAKHYLKFLLNPGSEEITLKNILAITFTNKASIEMKTRIFELLRNVALNSFARKAERDDILASLGIPPEAAAKNAHAVMDHIMRNYSRFRVQTVDSFIKEIIAGASFRLGLSSRFDIRTDYRDYLSRALDMLVDSSADDKKARAELKEFIIQYLHIENKAAWLPQKSMLDVVSDLYSKANTFGGDFNKMVEYNSKDLFALKRVVFGDLAKLYGMLPDNTHKGFKDKLTKIITGSGENFAVKELGKFFLRDEVPLTKGAKPDEKVKMLWSGIRAGINDVVKVEAFSFYNCYIDIYLSVMKNFTELSRKDDIMFLGELNRRANAVFADGSNVVPELYYRMSARFRHLLIDEFQDTSVIQWKNIKPMVGEVLSNGGSLFYVGDKKQAIYRFRGGDAELFDDVPGEFPGTVSRTEILGKNYRSRQELVAFNNGLFSAGNIERFMRELGGADEEKVFTGTEISDVLKIYSDSFQETGFKKPGGYVSVKGIECDNNDERDIFMKTELVSLVREIGKRRPYGEIAVLARKNDDLELFTGWLLESGIPSESEKTLNLKENGIIKELISFIIFLDSPIDNAALASFLLGNIFAKSAGLPEKEIERFLFALHRDSRGEQYLYKAFREKYPRIWNAYFEEFFVSVGFMPVYELVVSILARFRVTENFAEHQGFVSHLLELIKENEKERRSLKAFLEYYANASEKDIYLRFSGTDSVRLTTIHKAKGLEFPVVIIPYLSMDISGSEGRGQGSYFLNKTENGLSLVKLTKEHADFCGELASLYADNRKKSAIDELNAAYVALTRAKDELYAFIPEKNSGRKNAARVFVEADIDTGSRPPKSTESANSVNILPSAVYGDWLKILKDEFTGDFDIESLAASRAGEAAHYALSFVGNLKGPDAVEALSAAIARLKTGYPSLKNIESVEERVRKAVNSENLKEIFYLNDEATVFNEIEILDASGVTRRVDRLIIAKDKVSVIDYKSSRDNIEAHKAQVAGYIDILRSAYAGKTLEGILVYLDTMTLEKVRHI